MDELRPTDAEIELEARQQAQEHSYNKESWVRIFIVGAKWARTMGTYNK
jgi:hypothetical protein